MKTNKKLLQTSVLALSLGSMGFAQERYGNRDRIEREHLTRIEPGTNISVRTNQFINSNRVDNRVYYGTITQDIRGGNGRLAIPAGSQVELIVRTARDNDLILDLESVTIAGLRYGLETGRERVDAGRPDNSLVGQIVGAISGDQVNGRMVKIRRGTVLNFRLERPLVVGVADRGDSRRDGHYHDYQRP